MFIYLAFFVVEYRKCVFTRGYYYEKLLDFNNFHGASMQLRSSKVCLG